VSHANVIAVLSPKGGVGKTTCAFVLGDLLASATDLRCVALDTNPDFGTLGTLAPSASRAAASVADIFAEMDEIDSAAELEPFVSVLPSGLHLIAAHPRAEVMAALTPDLHALLAEFLARFYDVILMDLGTSVAAPQAQRALERADQGALVSTADFAALSTVLDARRYLPDHPVTLVLNQVPGRPGVGARREVERELAGQGIERHVILPYDDRLRAMLDSATYALGTLDRATRVPIKELGVAAAERLS
jgi:pilus assembly protein CpaE